MDLVCTLKYCMYVCIDYFIRLLMSSNDFFSLSSVCFEMYAYLIKSFGRKAFRSVCETSAEGDQR